MKTMLKLTSNLSNISKVEVFVEEIATIHKISAEKYPNILISLMEAVNNAIIHGNNEDEKKFVNIKLNKSGDSLAFKVSDEGTGFNPNCLPDPTSPENIEECGGRGVFLMRELSDKIKFYDNGRTVEMCFNI